MEPKPPCKPIDLRHGRMGKRQPGFCRGACLASAILKRLVIGLFAVECLIAGPIAEQEGAKPEPSRMWALIIGASSYTRVSPLQYAASDARSFFEFITSPRGGSLRSDHVFMLLEEHASRRAIEVELESMQARVQPGDTVYVFMAGHGHITARGIGYFIPIDGDMRVPASTSISFASLKELIDLGLANAERRIFVTDLCHAGKIGPEVSPIAGKILELIQAEFAGFSKAPRSSFLNLLSSHSLEQSWESDKLKRGIFSHLLLTALNGKAARAGNKVVQAKDVVAFLQAEVPKYTQGKQHPMVNDGYDPTLPLSFLESPGPEQTPAKESHEEVPTFLRLLNGDQTTYSRLQWLDARSQSQVVRAIPWHTNSFAIEGLAPGTLDLTFFDADHRTSQIQVRLESGGNTLDLLTMKFRNATASPSENSIKIAALTTGGIVIPAVSVRSLPGSAAEPANSSVLLIKLERGARLFLDEAYWATGSDDDKYLQIQGLSPGAHTVRLLTSADREIRIRVRINLGMQRLDVQSGELSAVTRIEIPPSFLRLPPDLPPSLESAYRQYSQALWENRLIEPPGRSAWEFFEQMQSGLPADLRLELRNRLLVAMGNRSQGIILRYLRGGDIRWNAAVFGEGADLLRRTLSYLKGNGSLLAQERFFAGRRLVELGRYAEAIPILRQASTLDPEASYALNALGLALWKQNRLSEAEVPLLQALEITPGWTYPRNTLALIRLEQRRYDEAEAAFRLSLQWNAEDTAACHGLGQLDLLHGRWESAEQNLRKAIASDPGNAYAHETLGKLHQRRQETREAEGLFRLAIRLEPEETSFYLSLAELLQGSSRLDEASGLIEAQLGKRPEDPRLLQVLARNLSMQNKTKEAETAMRRSLRAVPGDAQARVALGLFLQEQKRLDEAGEAFAEAVRLSGELPYGSYNLALIRIAQKRLPEAEKALDAAMKADPRYPAAPFLLGRMRFSQKRFLEAAEMYRRAMGFTVDPHQREEINTALREAEDSCVEAAVTEARQQGGKGNYRAAWTALSRALPVQPSSRLLRDAVLELPPGFLKDVDLQTMPPGELVDVLKTEFWRACVQAELLWQEGKKDRAVDRVAAAIQSLGSDESRLVQGTFFNLDNDRNGLHGIVLRWVARLVEAGEYSKALGLFDAALSRKFFSPVPGVSSLMVDSLIVSPEIPEPKSFSDFEVAHHPDRRFHELYSACLSGLGKLEEARRYLLALESESADLPARLSIARALRRGGLHADAIALLQQGIAGADSKASAVEGYLLLADLQYAAGDVETALKTLDQAIRRYPGIEELKKARRRLEVRENRR